MASHEEEALLGNLFAEVHPAGITESVEQPTSLGSDQSNNQQGPIQLAADLICFMRSSIFSPEMVHGYIYGCLKKIQHLSSDQFRPIQNFNSEVSSLFP